MGVQLSLKAALPLAGILATASDRCSKTGPWTCFVTLHPALKRVKYSIGSSYVDERKKHHHAYCMEVYMISKLLIPCNLTDDNGKDYSHSGLWSSKSMARNYCFLLCICERYLTRQYVLKITVCGRYFTRQIVHYSKSVTLQGRSPIIVGVILKKAVRPL